MVGQWIVQARGRFQKMTSIAAFIPDINVTHPQIPVCPHPAPA
jgi:hypothetical protein